jgi:hypothetical protein
MTTTLDRLYQALALPAATAINRRVPKTVFNEQADLSAADKRLLDRGLERLDWRGTLRPASVGLAAYEDDVRACPQIVVMSARLRPGAIAERLTTVIHRAIAHPLLLLCETADGVVLSAGLKRHHERETGRVVVERMAASPPMTVTADATPVTAAFLNSLALAGIGGRDLWALHQGWAERIEALSAARITGSFRLPRDAIEAEARRGGLADHAAQVRNVGALRKRAQAEKQLNRRIDLAGEVARAEVQLAGLLARLT